MSGGRLRHGLRTAPRHGGAAVVTRWCLLVAVAAAGVNGAGAEAPAALVFTLSSMPVHGEGATTYVLDRRGALEARLGMTLPRDEERAEAEVRRRLESGEGRWLLEELRAAMRGSVLAGRLGIARLPAVVIEGKYVVYGVRDVERALDLVDEWTAGRGHR